MHADGPILLISNHANAWDPLFVGVCLRYKHVYYVASEHLFRLGLITRILNWMVAPIPRRKASSGMDTVKACLRHLREGHSVCLFAEGEQCWDGCSAPIFSATGKLAKSSGASLVTFRLEGAYLSLPRWAHGIRRGEVYAHPVGIYSPEQLSRMTAQEVNELIERDICEDEWERQRRNPVCYHGKRLAEGIERALYACPVCQKIGTLQTHNDQIFCRCGFKRRYTETGFFEPADPFETIAEWDRWQRELLRSRSFPHEGDLLFSDSGIELSIVQQGHAEKLLGVGELCQYDDRLTLCGKEFALKEISNMALVQAHLLLFSRNGEYYQIRTRAESNLRKYLEIWKEKH